MKKTRVLIADASERFANELKDVINLDSDFQTVGIAITGIDTLKMLDKLRPDMLIIDLLLPLKDGIQVLKELCGYQNPPVVIATSAFAPDYVSTLAYKYGAACLVKKPCVLQDVIIAMKQNIHNDRLLDPMLNHITLDKAITMTLQSLHISSTTKGYVYLKEAILKEIFSPGSVTVIKKAIYLPLSQKYCLTAEHIALEINAVIKNAAKQLNQSDYYKVLGCHIHSNTITAAELIGSIANKLLYSL